MLPVHGRSGPLEANPVPSAPVPAQQISPVLLALIAGGFTVLGVLLKIGYDTLAARRASKSEALAMFAPERREAYEKFLALVQRQRDYNRALHELAEVHRRGEDVPQERLETFPASPMQQLVEALEEVRRLAHLRGDLLGGQRLPALPRHDRGVPVGAGRA
jgi:hypothetical protein